MLECPGLRASVFCVARLWASSESGAAFLHDGVSAPCPVGLPVLERWLWWRPGGQQHSAKDLVVIAFGGDGGGVGGGL